MHRGRDAISVAQAEVPPVVLATEHRGDPEVQRHEFVAADALAPRVFDRHASTAASKVCGAKLRPSFGDRRERR